MSVDQINAANNEAAYWKQSKEASADRATTQTSTGANGQQYTTSVSNDTLSNNDFLKLMIEELKMQDPTKPMDTQAMMDSQLKMATIQANQDMSKSMQKLEAAYSTSSLSTAANLIGKTIEDGSQDDKGVLKSYKVETIEKVDGKLYVNARQWLGIVDKLGMKVTEDGKEVVKLTKYDTDGYILDDKGEKTEIRVKLDANKRFVMTDGKITLLDKDNKVITDDAITSKYGYSGSENVYSTAKIQIPLENVAQVRG